MNPNLKAAVLQLLHRAFESGDVSSPHALYNWLCTRTEAEFNLLATGTGNYSLQSMTNFSIPQLTEGRGDMPVNMPPPAIPASKPKKALNAFVANRTWLLRCPEFNGLQMKEASGLIGMLWAQNFERALWALIANAWSDMRDRYGKDQVPLKKFLDIACPLLNVTSPSDYFNKFGWKMVLNEEGKAELARTSFPVLEDFGPNAFTTTFSANDIISHCHQVGFIPYMAVTDPASARSTMGPVPSQSFAMVGRGETQASFPQQIIQKRKLSDDHSIDLDQGTSSKRSKVEPSAFASVNAQDNPLLDDMQRLEDDLRMALEEELLALEVAPPVLDRQLRQQANTRAAWAARDLSDLFGPESQIVPAGYDDHQNALAEEFPWDIKDMPCAEPNDWNDVDFFNIWES